MDTISLEGRVAIVTGAGRGLGKAYAELLAARGAAVVVNDLGSSGAGEGSDASVAEAVVNGIRAAGGHAVANAAGVETEAGGASIVEAALSAFDRIDIIVTNAGIVGNQPFADATMADFERYWRIHLGGTVNVVRPAWARMREQKHGRVVLVESSAGLYGLEGQATYAAAKGAIHGLMRTLALEGEPDNVLVNSVMPGGFSRMMGAALDDPKIIDWMKTYMAPEMVAPLVAYLASNECCVSGETLTAWSGRFARVTIGSGNGLFRPDATPEDVAAGMDSINAMDGFFVPRRNLDEITNWLKLGLIPPMA